jgi:hypothetical protein
MTTLTNAKTCSVASIAPTFWSVPNSVSHTASPWCNSVARIVRVASLAVLASTSSKVDDDDDVDVPPCNLSDLATSAIFINRATSSSFINRPRTNESHAGSRASARSIDVAVVAVMDGWVESQTEDLKTSNRTTRHDYDDDIDSDTDPVSTSASAFSDGDSDDNSPRVR